ncbi:nad fad-dependent oxidoreductase [Lasius niger]|uniref:Nad fad-dependent oxidoreductase n=1 Tax=Lasius niger TaxID=67767 RepID=A0A0J7JTC6_LASNI|nr:nad fad-dependent oxidoreductase [Lasius niger]
MRTHVSAGGPGPGLGTTRRSCTARRIESMPGQKEEMQCEHGRRRLQMPEATLPASVPTVPTQVPHMGGGPWDPGKPQAQGPCCWDAGSPGDHPIPVTGTYSYVASAHISRGTWVVLRV